MQQLDLRPSTMLFGSFGPAHIRRPPGACTAALGRQATTPLSGLTQCLTSHDFSGELHAVHWPHSLVARRVTASATANATATSSVVQPRVLRRRQVSPLQDSVEDAEQRPDLRRQLRPRTAPAGEGPSARVQEREHGGEASRAPTPVGERQRQGDQTQQQQQQPVDAPPQQLRPKSWQEEAVRQRQEYQRQQEQRKLQEEIWQGRRQPWQGDERRQQWQAREQRQPFQDGQRQQQRQSWQDGPRQQQRQPWRENPEQQEDQPWRERQHQRPVLMQQQQRQSDSEGDPHALRTGLALTWLGTNSGSPTLERNVSCTLVRLPGAAHMVDCGEGTHRQLLALPALQQAEVDGIFITHLHGDHCFGLAATLALLDEAKAAQQTDPARRRNHVYGPPGLAELLRASLFVTGLSRRLQLPLTITEFVCSPASAHPPRPLEGNGDGDKQSGGGVYVQRLAPRRVRDAADLQAAAKAVRERVASLEQIWLPPRQHPAVLARHALGATLSGPRPNPYLGAAPDPAEEADLLTTIDHELDEQNASVSGSAGGHYWPFAAVDGLFWELPGCAGVSVRAAQLQHRVPCWGYVFREKAAAVEGMRRRKVVVLGDTVSSHAIAPLAAGCDVLSHEATFAVGMEGKARVAQHSTGRMAGAFAAAIGARQLVLTHFSARYREAPREVEFNRFSRANIQRELEQQSWAVTGLMREASGPFQRPGAIFAAHDYYTHHVPLREAPAAAADRGAAATASSDF